MKKRESKGKKHRGGFRLYGFWYQAKIPRGGKRISQGENPKNNMKRTCEFVEEEKRRRKQQKAPTIYINIKKIRWLQCTIHI